MQLSDSNSDNLIFALDTDERVLSQLKALFSATSMQVATFTEVDGFKDALKQKHPVCVICDWKFNGEPDVQVLSLIKEVSSQTPVVILSHQGDVTSAVTALKSGAKDYIEKPYVDRILLEKVNAAISAYQ